jgi:hypothetical protein
MFRWDAGQKIARSAGGWIVVALAAWAAVGVAAEYRGRAVVRMPPPPAAGGTASWQAVTDAQIASITYDDLQPDDGTVTPLLASLAGLKPDAANEIDEFKRALAQWPPGRESDLPQRLRNLLSICAVADLVENDLEAAYPRVIFDQLQAEVPKPDLVKALAWIILHPDDGRVMTSASEFGITGQESQRSVRERVTAYAKKLLERLVNPPRAG